MNSILETIRESVCGNSQCAVYDTELIMYINLAMMTLSELGVIPANGFSVNGCDESWNDVLGEEAILDSIKAYILMRVKVMFDPPSNSSVLESFNRSIAETEWRLRTYVEDIRKDSI